MSDPSGDDRNAINDLFVRYMWAIDSGDVDTLVGCFTENGSLESPVVGKVTGHDGIRAFAERFARYQASGHQLRHVISNLMIDVDGNSGRGRCYLVTYLTHDNSSRLLGPGTYDCELAKVDGRWLFHNRLVVNDLNYEVPGI